MKIKRRASINAVDGLTLIINSELRAPEGSAVWGVGIDFSGRETLPEWAQSQMRLIDMFYTHRQESWYVLPGVGHKGGIWYEFIGPKWEGEVDDFKR